VIRIEGASFRYGSRAVLSDVSLEVGRGRIVGILGPNGSGKTTLVRILLGLLRPASGSVSVSGRDVGSYGRRELARELAAVPQETPVDFPFTVMELVLMGRTPHLGLLGIETAADVRAAEEAMDACGVRHLAERPIDALSGGELRRAVIARALAQGARALVLDEPTAGLDIHHQVAIFDLLRRQAREGRAILVVVHDLNLAAAYCDELLLLKDGRTEARGAVEDVLTYHRIKECYGVDVYVGVNEVTGARFLLPMGARP
jgi:iron complex transport system ATP-binding protein